MNIDPNTRPLATMKLVGGRLCLDFVNTLGGRIEADFGASIRSRQARLNDYFDLLAWAIRTELLSVSEARSLSREGGSRQKEATEIFQRALELREAIYRATRAVVVGRHTKAEDMRILNEELKISRSRREIVPQKQGFGWQWSNQDRSLDRMLWPIVESAAEMLTLADLTRIRQCPGEGCGWLFDDTSRNRSRQWC